MRNFIFSICFLFGCSEPAVGNLVVAETDAETSTLVDGGMEQDSHVEVLTDASTRNDSGSFLDSPTEADSSVVIEPDAGALPEVHFCPKCVRTRDTSCSGGRPVKCSLAGGPTVDCPAGPLPPAGFSGGSIYAFHTWNDTTFSDQARPYEVSAVEQCTICTDTLAQVTSNHCAAFCQAWAWYDYDQYMVSMEPTDRTTATSRGPMAACWFCVSWGTWETQRAQESAYNTAETLCGHDAILEQCQWRHSQCLVWAAGDWARIPTCDAIQIECSSL